MSCGNKLMMLIKTTSANLKRSFGRFSCIKITATFTAKALHPLITTFGNFEKFGYSARNFDITHWGDRKSEKWHAAKFLAIGAMTGHDLIW